MALIKSISGIRGTIGGMEGENLTPMDIVKFSCAFAQFLKMRYEKTDARGLRAIRVVVGRDGRMSGDMVNRLVTGSLLGMGVNVIDLGLSTTPTVEMAVVHHRAQGGIILTASHNPAEWNALKLLGRSGEFLDAAEGQEVLALAEKMDFSAAPVHRLGKLTCDTKAIAYHISKVLRTRDVDPHTIKEARLRVVVDGINSTGGEV
ncbi:MAG: phosphoglucosamine mutase, partial [Bacteroidales bacterium]|nr:phosphoglucosamine mutase [Bacteroidales bacterium]